MHVYPKCPDGQVSYSPAFMTEERVELHWRNNMGESLIVKVQEPERGEEEFGKVIGGFINKSKASALGESRQQAILMSRE